MKRLSWLTMLIASLCLASCSVLIDPNDELLGEGEPPPAPRPDPDPDPIVTDSGPAPAPTPDGAPTPTPPDGSLPPTPMDSGPEPECTPGEDLCDGEVWRFCDDMGVFRSQDCPSERAFCDEGCQPWVCTPSSTECAPDFSSVIECDARGSMMRRTPCALGCDPTTSACIRSPAECAAYPVIVPGMTQTFDLCRETNDHTFLPDRDECTATSVTADVGERIYTLFVPRRSRVVINLYDADSSAVIDTVLYLRSSCNERSSQLDCSDDIDCSESTVPGPGGCVGMTEVRQSIIDTRLDAGTYYIVADAFEYSSRGTSYGCGRVSLEVRLGS